VCVLGTASLEIAAVAAHEALPKAPQVLIVRAEFCEYYQQHD
jgi:hypothetical protein